jgi:uncharacterized phage protein gp47/JayE
MKLNEKQTIARKRISEIETAITKAIDKICEDENFEVSYSEINAAMLNVMKNFNGHELKELWKEDL